jgi:predicted dehydrogenase
MPLVQQARELIGDAEICDIRYRMARMNRLDADFPTTAIHGIDLVKFMARGDYENLRFLYRKVKTATHFHLSGQTENGVIVHLDFLPVANVDTERLEINTDRGMFCLRLPIWENCYDGQGELTHIVDNRLALRLSEAGEGYVLGGFYGENAGFFDDLRNNKKPEGDIASGLQSVDVADYLRRRENTYKK